MFKINKETKEIQITRGDIGCIEVSSKNEDGSLYEFQVGDIVRFKVFKAKDCDCVELQKDVVVEVAGTTMNIDLTKEDTRIGDLIDKSVPYWYEIELNPDTAPQTIVGVEYNEETKKDEPKIFRLLPEGADK